MFSLSTVLLLSSGLLQIASATSVTQPGRYARGIARPRQNAMTTTTDNGSATATATASSTAADPSATDGTSSSNEIPTVCFQLCQPYYDYTGSIDDLCPGRNSSQYYAGIIDCANCLYANGEPGATNITDVQGAIDAITNNCDQNLNDPVSSTGTITLSQTATGPFTTYPDMASATTSVSVTVGAGGGEGAGAAGASGVTSSATTGLASITSAAISASSSKAAASTSMSKSLASSSSSASASASASAAKTGGAGIRADAGRLTVLGGALTVLGLVIA